MTAQVEQLGGDTVRLKVDVPGHDVHHAVEHATSTSPSRSRSSASGPAGRSRS